MIPLDEAWGWAARAVAGGSLVLAAGSAAVALARTPAHRARLASWTLAGALLVPFLGLVPAVPRWSIAPAPAAGIAPGAAEAPGAVAAPAPPPAPGIAEAPARPRPGPIPVDPAPGPAARPGRPSLGLDPRGPVLAAWGLVGLGWLGWWGLGQVLLGRVAGSARPAGGLARARLDAIAGVGAARVRLLASDRVARPITFTRLRPTIILPAAMAGGADPAELTFALAHEWSHVERNDYRSWTLALLAGTLWAVHPLYWHLRRVLRLAQDFLADDRAAGAESPEAFAAYLVRLARARRDRARLPLPALGIGGRRSHLTRRVQMLLADRPPLARRCRAAWTAAAAPPAALLLIAAAGLRLDAAPRPAGPQDRAAGPHTTVEVGSRAPFAFIPLPQQAAPGPAAGKANPAATPPAPNQPASGSGPVAAGGREWSGRVVDQATGQPIAGAEVWIEVGRFDPVLGESRPGRDIVTTAGDDGSYRFVVAAEEHADPLLTLNLTIGHPDHISVHDGNAYATLLKAVGRGERPSFDRIELAAARPVEGVLVDPDGAPVAGVRVVARSDRGENMWGYEAVRTDARGRFRVPLAAKGPGTLWILPEQFEPQAQAIPADRHGDLGTLQLGRGVRLGGRVTDTQGRPVGGVFVAAKVNSHPAAARYLPSSDPGDEIGRSALTLADGTFTLGPLPPGTIEVRPQETPLHILFFGWDPTERDSRNRVDYRPLPAAFLPQDVQIREGEVPKPLAIRAVPEVRVAAQLVNRRGEKHGFDTWADLSGMVAGREWAGHVRVESDGRIVMTAPRDLERSRFQVMANQYRKLLYRADRSAPLLPRLELPADPLDHDFIGIEVVSSLSASVRVRANDREGRAIANFSASVAEVPRVPARKDPVPARDGVTTISVSLGSGDGKSWTYWIDPDKEVEVKVEAAGFKSASRRVTLPEGKTEEVVFVLEPR